MRKNIPNRQAFISFQPCTFNLAKKKEKDICHLPLNAMQYPIQKLKLFSDKHCILENHPLNQNENKQCWSVHTHTQIPDNKKLQFQKERNLETGSYEGCQKPRRAEGAGRSRPIPSFSCSPWSKNPSFFQSRQLLLWLWALCRCTLMVLMVGTW